jgi:hypothetical protein
MKQRITVDEVLTNYGLDFNITKEKLESLSGNETPYYGLFNDKTGECLNTCKIGYVPSQNRDVVELVLEGMKNFGDGLNVYKAGALGGGKKVFMQLEVAGLSIMNGKDTIKRYVTVIDSNDGSTGLSVGIGDLTMSCQNQFFKFYKKGDAKFRHTRTLEEKLKTIPTLIQYALDESIQQVKVYKEFQSTPISRMLANKMVNAVLGHDRTTTEKVIAGKSLAHMDSLYTDIYSEMDKKGDNLWGLHSGVTKWTTHTRTQVKGFGASSLVLAETLMTGKSYELNQKSFNFAAKQLGYQLADDNMLLV